MCMTAEAFALFLNILSPDSIVSAPGHITIDATVRAAHWVAVEDEWCTMAPQIDRMERVSALLKDD
ncbi:hypothetical protein [Antarctobacter jejuensis]|uniref:hypothetical protein n=1 Tax=Antarctobacter jejuensis TaxID=1439938 RepID=UPI003FCFE103